MDALNTVNRHFKPLLKRALLPDIRLYDLRHTFAMLWLESGEHPKILGGPRALPDLDHVGPRLRISERRLLAVAR